MKTTLQKAVFIHELHWLLTEVSWMVWGILNICHETVRKCSSRKWKESMKKQQVAERPWHPKRDSHHCDGAEERAPIVSLFWFSSGDASTFSMNHHHYFRKVAWSEIAFMFIWLLCFSLLKIFKRLRKIFETLMSLYKNRFEVLEQS
jgi:hypothetical protein